MTPQSWLRPTWGERLQMFAVGPRDVILYLACRSYRSFVWSFERLLPGYLAWSSRIRARRAFYRAAREVPAYAAFLAQHAATRTSIPETDKASYISAFPPEARCVHGRMPKTHTMIEES